ncbi:hypothetical protein SAMN05216499_1741, partial [Actinacidiphila paucisporea]
GEVGGVEVGGHRAVRSPQPPRQRRRGKSLSPAVPGESVEIRVRGSVITLPRRPDHPGGRREQHERPEIGIPRQFIQNPRPTRLGTHHRVDPFGSQSGHDTVIKNTSGMDDRRQRMLRRNTIENLGQGITISHITGRIRNRRTGSRQLGNQPNRTVHTTTTQQQQMTHPIPGHQMPGNHMTQRTRSPGNQHRALSTPTLRGPPLPRDRHQPRNQQTVTHHGDLGLTRSHRNSNSPPGIHLKTGIDHQDPPGMLGLRRPQQTPHSRSSRIRTLGNITTSDHSQPRIVIRRISDKALHATQDIGHTRTDITARPDLLDNDLGRHHTHAAGNRHIDPAHLEQRITRNRRIQLPPRHRLKPQLLHRNDRMTGTVKRRHPHPTVTPRQHHPQHRRTHRIQPHPTPGERHLQTIRRQRMQRRVQQRRMNTETPRLNRQPNLREQVITHTPQTTKPLEHRPIPITQTSQHLISTRHIHPLSTHRRPHTLKQTA